MASPELDPIMRLLRKAERQRDEAHALLREIATTEGIEKVTWVQRKILLLLRKHVEER